MLLDMLGRPYMTRNSDEVHQILAVHRYWYTAFTESDLLCRLCKKMFILFLPVNHCSLFEEHQLVLSIPINLIV